MGYEESKLKQLLCFNPDSTVPEHGVVLKEDLNTVVHIVEQRTLSCRWPMKQSTASCWRVRGSVEGGQEGRRRGEKKTTHAKGSI